MPDPDPSLRTDLALLAEAAEAAGRIALRFWRRNPEAWDKPEGAGPVTEADLAVDRMLREELRLARPHYGWLSEESEDEPARLEAERVFIVDPIDGTRAFMAGEETWSHSLAVAERGRVVAGVVRLPVTGAVYAAAAAGPATLNGRPLAVSRRAALAEATLLASGAAMRPEHWVGGQAPPVRRVFRASIAYRLGLVAEGRFDAMLATGGTWEWDIAAGSLIVARAGGRVTDRAGAEIAFNAPLPRTRGVIAAPPLLHAALRANLAP